MTIILLSHHNTDDNSHGDYDDDGDDVDMLIWGDENSDNDSMTVYLLLFLLPSFSCHQSSTLAGTSGILKDKYREWMNFLRNL